MSKAAISVLAQALLVTGAALAFLLAPGLVLPILGMGSGGGWVEVLSVILLGLSWLYLSLARADTADALLGTIGTRLIVASGLVVLVATGSLPWPLLGFAGLDLLTACWTFVALRAR